jgi:integrase
MAKALTGVALPKLKPNPSKRLEIPDGVLTGLYFVIQPTGRKSWAVRYRAHGKPRKMVLGNYLAGDESKKAGEELSRIRKEAADILERVRQGKDPAAEQQRAKKTATDEAEAKRDLFRTVVDRYLRDYASKRRNFSEKARLLGLRRKGEDWEIVKGRAVDLWGGRRIQEITRRDIRDHLDKLAVSAPIGVNRTYSELRKFYNWCVGKDILDTSPIKGMQPPSEERDSRDRTLIRRSEVPGSTDDELRWLWQACAAYDAPDPEEKLHGRKHRGPFGPFVQVLILTGQRRTEVAQMTWSEIDLEKRLWVIPGNRAKNGEPHFVPLSDAAMTIIEAMPRIKSKGYVFTTHGEHAISGFSRMKQRIDKLMAEAANKQRGEAVTIPDWGLHDLRRTVAAGMQRLGVKMEVTEKVLNHTSGSFGGIVGVYQVHDYADEKRTALQTWGRFVTDVVEGKPDNVIRLERERA